MPKPTIVLVHGAWADGSSWNAVSTELQGQGFSVLTPPNLLRGVAGDAAYIASWLETLRSDRKEIFRAAAAAQRIADYLLALHPDYATRHLAATISAEDAPAAESEPQADSSFAAQ